MTLDQLYGRVQLPGVRDAPARGGPHRHQVVDSWQSLSSPVSIAAQVSLDQWLDPPAAAQRGLQLPGRCTRPTPRASLRGQALNRSPRKRLRGLHWEWSTTANGGQLGGAG